MSSSPAFQRTPSRIEYDAVTKTLRELVDSLNADAIAIPPHQREFCWSVPKSQRFISTVMTGLPTMTILMREERNADAPFLEDGRQRLTTMKKFLNDEIPTSDCDDLPADQRNKLFSQLPPQVQRQIECYKMVVTKYKNATVSQAIEIFDRFNNGLPLSIGERYHSLAAISPIIKFTVDTLLTPGVGLHDEMMPIWGARAGVDPRYSKLKNAVAICMGLAFGSEAITHKYETIRQRNWLKKELTDMDKASMIGNLRCIRDIYAEVNRQQPNATKKMQGLQWAVGKITGYLLHSLVTFPTEHTRLMRGWVTFLVSARRNPSLIEETLLRDRDAARFYTQNRWEMGYLRVFDPEEADRRTAVRHETVEEDGEEESETDTTE